MGELPTKIFLRKISQKRCNEVSMGQTAITGISTLRGAPLKAQTRLYFLHTNVAQSSFYDVGV
jgi:hypothetical protein